MFDAFCETVDVIFAGSVKSGVSFTVRKRRTLQLVGVSLNMQESELDTEQYYTHIQESHGAMVCASRFVRLEKPVLHYLKRAYTRIVIALVSCVGLDLLQSYEDRVSVMFEMEKRLIDFAIERGAQAILTTNTSQVTQDTAEVLGYECRATGSLNDCIDPETQSRPFDAKKDQRTKTYVKILAQH